jgi:hypothetical protein
MPAPSSQRRADATVAVATMIGFEQSHNGLAKLRVPVAKAKLRPMIKIGTASEVKPCKCQRRSNTDPPAPR